MPDGCAWSGPQAGGCAGAGGGDGVPTGARPPPHRGAAAAAVQRAAWQARLAHMRLSRARPWHTHHKCTRHVRVHSRRRARACWCEATLLARRYLLTHMPDTDSVTCFQALPPELDTLQVGSDPLQHCSPCIMLRKPLDCSRMLSSRAPGPAPASVSRGPLHAGAGAAASVRRGPAGRGVRPARGARGVGGHRRGGLPVCPAAVAPLQRARAPDPGHLPGAPKWQGFGCVEHLWPMLFGVQRIAGHEELHRTMCRH